MPPSIRLEDQVQEVWTSSEGSMAKQTAATRWPKIVQGMIDDVWDTMAQMSPGPQRAAGSKIQRALHEIREGIEKDSALRYVVSLHPENLLLRCSLLQTT